MFQRMKNYSEDEIILREGEENDTIYKIVMGKAAVYINYGEKNEFLIGILSKARYFGEVECLTSKTSKYTIVAVTDVTVLMVRKEEFEDFVRKYPVNAIDIMKDMSMEICSLHMHMDLIVQEITEIIDGNTSAKDNKELLDIRDKLQRFRTITPDMHDGFNCKS